MLKIAVVDHHLNNFHADKYAGLLRGALADREAILIAAYESDPIGDDWCALQGVARADSPEEAIRDADAVLLLAPDNIEAHLRLAASIIPAGKPVFLDKLLATNRSDAHEIVHMARRHRTPLYSCSALRHAVEIETARKQIDSETIVDLAVRGLGDWERYGIHTIAMTLRLMGHGVRRVADTGTAVARTVTLDYSDGRRAALDVRAAENEWEVFGWSFAARVRNRYVAATIADYDGFYRNQLAAVLDFFRTGEPPALIEEALIAVAVIEAAERSRQDDGTWQTLGI